MNNGMSSQEHAGNDWEEVFVREFEVFVDEGIFVALPCDMEGGTQGTSFNDAVYMAADWLRDAALASLAKGKALPGGALGHVPQYGGRVIAVAVLAGRDDIPAMTAADAARVLNVSTARVAQLCKAGKLDSWRVGATRMVSKESVEMRKILAQREEALGERSRASHVGLAAAG